MGLAPRLWCGGLLAPVLGEPELKEGVKAVGALGEWSLPKTRQQGMTWNVEADGAGVSEVTAGCGRGLTAVLGTMWGLYSVVRSQPPLETCARSPLEMREPGSGLAVGMGEQAHAMTQRFLEEKQ